VCEWEREDNLVTGFFVSACTRTSVRATSKIDASRIPPNSSTSSYTLGFTYQRK
jgi:hypothetical protein